MARRRSAADDDARWEQRRRNWEAITGRPIPAEDPEAPEHADDTLPEGGESNGH